MKDLESNASNNETPFRRRRGSRKRNNGDDISDSRASSFDDEGSNSTDDRKPPAREVMVPNNGNRSTTTASSSRRPRSNSESDGFTIASSVMTPVASAASPMALIPPSTDKTGLAVAAATQSSATSNQQPPQVLVTRQDFQLREAILERRLVVLASAALFSLAAFLYCILPLSALFYLMLGAASTGMAGQQAAEYAQVTFEDRLRYGGFAEWLLPPQLYDLLTQRTLHDLLIRLHEQTDVAEMELRHMLLYFLPGLTVEQRNSYIQRLPRRHRLMLEQPGGLAQFLGPTALRYLIGEDGVAAQEEMLQQTRRRPRQQQNTTPQIIRLDSNVSSTTNESERRAMENARPAAALMGGDADSASSSSDLGLDISGNDLSGGLSDQQARSMARRLNISETGLTNETVVLSRAPIPEETSFDEEEEDEESDVDVDNAEMRILVEAAMSTVRAEIERFLLPAFASASEYTSRVTRQVASSVASYGYRAALAAGGVGLAGFLITSYRSGGASSLTNFGLVARDLFRPLSQRGAGSSPNQSMFATLVLGSGGAAATLYWADRMLQHTDEEDEVASRKSIKSQSTPP